MSERDDERISEPPALSSKLDGEPLVCWVDKTGDHHVVTDKGNWLIWRAGWKSWSGNNLARDQSEPRRRLAAELAACGAREALWLEYVQLIVSEVSRFSGIAYAHGICSDPESVQRGIELRVRLGLDDNNRPIPDQLSPAR